MANNVSPWNKIKRLEKLVDPLRRPTGKKKDEPKVRISFWD